MSAEPIRITHVITNLYNGGAETFLFNLLSRIDRERFRLEVITLTGDSPYGQKLAQMGIPVRTLEMRRGLPNPWLVLRLARWLRESRPELVQTWLYHADMLGSLANRLGPRAPLVWSVHHTNPDPAHTKSTTLWMARLSARLSASVPARILFCSETSRRLHFDFGYDREKSLVIPNGFDLQAYHPDPEAYRSVRAELGLEPDTPLIGLVARFNPAKDHRTFCEAARLLATEHPRVRFLLCGLWIDEENAPLIELIESNGLRERALLLGHRRDVPRITAALDIASSSSIGEAFSTTIGEAMGCEVPCAVTDVGDSALIVGDTGRVVPPRSPEALAGAWRELLALSPEQRRALGRAARERIEGNFEIGQVVRRYEAFYRELLGREES